MSHKITSYLLLGLLGLLAGACGDSGNNRNISDAHFIPTDGAPPVDLTVTQLEPNHGPVGGGTAVTVRGFGFTDGSRVYFGELLVDPDFTLWEGPNRMQVLTPPGNPGPVDITVQRTDGASAIFHGGYTYDILSVDPPSGSVAGGTFVRVVGVGTSFTAEDVVRFGDQPLEDQTWVSAGVITGRTPPSAPGSVAVRVEGAGDPIVVADAFSYYDGTDPINGGLGGGPIDGEVNITVLDTYTDEPVADCYVLMGADASSPFQGLTDAQGRITFSAPGLTGPQMVTAAANDYERASFLAFDARDVTIFLTPFIPPNPGTIPGQSWSMVNGYVSFGGVEFGQGCNFNQMVPEPGPNEVRIIKVYQTVPDIDYVTAEPGDSGTIHEGDDCIQAYSFMIFARPGSYAVYALAGIENQISRVFTPHAMGIARGLLSGPDQTITADIKIDISLGREMSFDFAAAPPVDPGYGPFGYKIRVYTDLGGDGYIVRSDAQRSVTDATEIVTVDHLPGLERGLSDGSHAAMLEAHSGGVYPYSKVFLKDLLTGPTPIDVSDWLGIPVAVDPAPGGVPSTNRMIWSADGFEPTYNIILVRTFPDGDMYWKLYTHGAVRQFVLPDLWGLGPGLDGHPSGDMYWHVISVGVEGITFDDFTYRYLNDKYWSSTAGDGFRFSFPDSQ